MNARTAAVLFSSRSKSRAAQCLGILRRIFFTGRKLHRDLTDKDGHPKKLFLSGTTGAI